jgi:hypothetical protein
MTKEINQQNWLEQDSTNEHLPKNVRAHKSQLGEILKPTLLNSVPSDVQALFEVARAAIVYGYLYYPLNALGTEQLFRVAEAAATHKCEEMQASKTAVQQATFEKKIDWLANKDLIDNKDFWNLIRKWRNTASHSTSQSVIVPRTAIMLLEGVAQHINALFPALSP